MLDYSAILSVLADLGEPEYRARQTYQALTRALMPSFDGITVLPASLRAALAARIEISDLTERLTLRAGDGQAEKALFEARDGALVEAVLLRSGRRATVCVSSQVGCAVRCPFCASGRHGLRRDLTAGEIFDQTLHFARRLKSRRERVTNVVVMGMGEPFHNYDATMRACRLMNDGDGFGLAARAISVSTSGVVPGIGRFAAEDEQFNLAVSLHAATDGLRDRLVPLNRTYPLDALFDACAAYAGRTRRKLLFEYVLLSGVNDGDEQITALIRRLRRPLYHLNVIAYNQTAPLAGVDGEACATVDAAAEAWAPGAFRAPTAAGTAAFAARLRAAGVACTVRRSPGADIDAACGQLALRERE